MCVCVCVCMCVCVCAHTCTGRRRETGGRELFFESTIIIIWNSEEATPSLGRGVANP